MKTQANTPPPGHCASLLSDLRVIDIASPQAYDCAKFMATLGAEVIRIDAQPAQDERRWAIGNVGKQSMTLDYTGEGRETFLQLVARSDILVESFLPGHLASLGLGFDDLKAVNPRLIQVSITPFGQQAPYRDYKGGELVVSALASNLWQMGEADKPPVREPGEPNFFHACAAGVFGALVAERERRETGRGQLVDISAQEMGAGRNTLWILQHQFAGGRTSQRLGQTIDLGWGGSRAVWALSDGYAFFQLPPPGSPLEKGLADWILEATGEHYESGDIAAAERFLATLSIKDAIAQSAPRDVRIMPVTGPREVADDPQLAARDFFVEHAGQQMPWRYLTITQDAGESA